MFFVVSRLRTEHGMHGLHVTVLALADPLHHLVPHDPVDAGHAGHTVLGADTVSHQPLSDLPGEHGGVLSQLLDALLLIPHSPMFGPTVMIMMMIMMIVMMVMMMIMMIVMIFFFAFLAKLDHFKTNGHLKKS